MATTQTRLPQIDPCPKYTETVPDTLRKSKFGFLAVTEVDNLGYCGGLLVLTAGGRPVEFHCTAPVSANRAQQILYGATLKDFLVCDQIAESLLQKSRSTPNLVLVDDRQLCSLATATQAPVVFVGKLESGESARSQSIQSGAIREIGETQLEIYGNDIDGAEEMLKLFLDTLPLSEPFERIYQAIDEAHCDAA